MVALALHSAAGTHVLLVDDDDGVLRSTQRLLQHAGHSVVTAHSGDEALALLAKEAFDVMVSDIQMPGITGLRLLRAVRDHDLDLPVVLMTGNPNIASAIDAVQYGAFRYLIKPIPFAELTSVVERAACVGRMARSKREYVEEFGSSQFRIGDRAGVDAALDRALTSLSTAYQPIVRAVGFEVVAHEALMRISEPSLPHPGAVLSAAERVGRLHDFGRAVRTSVVLSAASAPDMKTLLFVNLHPEDLLDPTLFVETSPFASLASRIVLEITERATLDHIADIRVRLSTLRARGFLIALDDLGAGYAGLTSFTQLEPEFVKLDMSLIRDIHLSPTKRKIVRSMVNLCHDMGKQLVAEGVETQAECDQLVELHCDLLQGYFFARPGPPFPGVAQ